MVFVRRILFFFAAQPIVFNNLRSASNYLCRRTSLFYFQIPESCDFCIRAQILHAVGAKFTVVTVQTVVTVTVHTVVNYGANRGYLRWMAQNNQVSKDSTNHIIKKSIAYRAKYKVTTKQIHPLLVVPHPCNRGGEPVKSLRTKQISGNIVTDGYDPTEAQSNAVVVEQKSDGSPPHNTRWTSFQDHFANNVQRDPDMACAGEGITAALAASLAHSHLNCTNRNILCGKRGCECPDPSESSKQKSAVAEKQPCTCKNKPILDDLGNYSMDKLKAHDPEWAQSCHAGVEWEVLSWKMDVEEPEAALLISIALNKTNEASMKTSHTEIMATLVALCKPDPRGIVQFDPVRDKLVELYGGAAEHPDYTHAFKLVIDAGGCGSTHMEDLHQFTKVFVNPKVRKLRMETYATVASYPVDFPKIKNACIKWSWRQDPNKGWCPPPPNILHRFSSEQRDNKNAMHALLVEIEESMLFLNMCASTVVEGPQAPKLQTRWIGEGEIGLMSKLFAVPKNKPDKTTTQLQTEARLECARYVADRLKELVKLGKEGFRRVDLPKMPDGSFFDLCLQELDRPDTAETSLVKENPPEVKLEPKVILFDASGRAASEHETKQTSKLVVVEPLPWTTWLEKQGMRSNNDFAKHLLWLAMDFVNDNAKTHSVPIALVKKGSATQALATRDIKKGELVIPLFFKKITNMYVPADLTHRHPDAVTVEVSWESVVTEEEKMVGIEEGSKISVGLIVQPEFRLPCKDAKGAYQWSLSDAVHPFWFMNRCNTEDTKANAEVKRQDMSHLMACSFDHLPPLDPATDTFSVSLPFIVNTLAISSGNEVIVQRTQNPTKTPKKAKTEHTFFDDIIASERSKRAKTDKSKWR